MLIKYTPQTFTLASATCEVPVNGPYQGVSLQPTVRGEHAYFAALVAGIATAAARATVTIGGVFHAGDVVTLTIDDGSGPVAVAYTVLVGDTDLAGIATALAAAVNDDVAMSALVTATPAGAVVTLEAVVPGREFNAATLAAAVTGAGNSVTAAREAATFGEATAGTGITSPITLSSPVRTVIFSALGGSFVVAKTEAKLMAEPTGGEDAAVLVVAGTVMELPWFQNEIHVASLDGTGRLGIVGLI